MSAVVKQKVEKDLIMRLIVKEKWKKKRASMILKQPTTDVLQRLVRNTEMKDSMTFRLYNEKERLRS